MMLESFLAFFESGVVKSSKVVVSSMPFPKQFLNRHLAIFAREQGSPQNLEAFQHHVINLCYKELPILFERRAQTLPNSDEFRTLERLIIEKIIILVKTPLSSQNIPPEFLDNQISSFMARTPGAYTKVFNLPPEEDKTLLNNDSPLLKPNEKHFLFNQLFRLWYQKEYTPVVIQLASSIFPLLRSTYQNLFIEGANRTSELRIELVETPPREQLNSDISSAIELISAILKRSSRLRNLYLDVNDNAIADLRFYEDALGTNSILESLSLVGANMNGDELIFLFNLLKSNKMLEELSLENCMLNSPHFFHLLISTLKENKTLKSIILKNNEIASHVPLKIGELLTDSSVLESIDLENIHIADDDVQLFAASLAENNTLTHLHLEKAGITDDGARKFSETLTRNKTLRFLTLKGNPISGKGIYALIQALSFNNTLESLILSDIAIMPFEDERNEYNPAYAIASYIAKNSTLKSLGMGNIKLNQEADIAFFVTHFQRNVSIRKCSNITFSFPNSDATKTIDLSTWLQINEQLEPVVDILRDIKNKHAFQSEYPRDFFLLLSALCDQKLDTDSIYESSIFTKIAQDFPEEVSQIDEMISVFGSFSPEEINALKNSAIYSEIRELGTFQKRTAPTPHHSLAKKPRLLPPQ